MAAPERRACCSLRTQARAGAPRDIVTADLQQTVLAMLLALCAAMPLVITRSRWGRAHP